MLTMSAEQRRSRLVRRHRLAPGHYASSVAEATSSMVVLHATDPATVYMSALARCPEATLDHMAAAMYQDRSLIKLIGMRRTMFVAPAPFAPVVHSAAGLEIAARQRRRLVKLLSDGPTEPDLTGVDIEAWLADVENGVEKALVSRGESFATELAEAEPRLRTALLPTTDKKWDVKQHITSMVLTLMGADGRIVRGRPGGTWLSRMHTWMAAREVWPDGLPEIPEAESRATLATAWLRAFGPATVADLKWWTGWTLGATREVLAGIDTVDVDLAGVPGIVLADDAELDEPVAPAAALLPALDPTPMGWQQRDFYLGAHREPLFDRNGNIGPTVWWDGRIVGGWAMKGPEIVWRLLEDVGSEAESAITDVAAAMQERLGSASVIPSFRTPLERELSA
ncbi:winged helix DNA-binding domain-containing protein [Phytoactinopolyspora alkaliphila]|uniref:Winged helix DNA-binding domain-containing protein n=1 Tax=Phytoactinopolyspora alkaliphila TaxID=1783498 RepID=A0A6N9YIK6_9ACTN|nr:winged helix DNA-binding domain-containing protein [Phytoactinopolyspora alkaliphila]NED94738.1 winged helix DNA-binding domain-containing protein [Phytoactinopolyspora alkaliphila]